MSPNLIEVDARLALEDLHQTFTASALVVPPIPSALQGRLRRLGPWLWSSREIERMDMYFFWRYAVEAVAAPTKDYIAISHAGHGANSYSINYHLVYGPLALFTQAGWGGLYTDRDKAAASVAGQFRASTALIDAVDSLRSKGWLGRRRLLVLDSDFRGSAVCAWLDQPLESEEAASTWLRKHAGRGTGVLATALGEMESLVNDD